MSSEHHVGDRHQLGDVDPVDGVADAAADLLVAGHRDVAAVEAAAAAPG